MDKWKKIFFNQKIIILKQTKLINCYIRRQQMSSIYLINLREYINLKTEREREGTKINKT